MSLVLLHVILLLANAKCIKRRVFSCRQTLFCLRKNTHYALANCFFHHLIAFSWKHLNPRRTMKTRGGESASSWIRSSSDHTVIWLPAHVRPLTLDTCNTAHKKNPIVDTRERHAQPSPWCVFTLRQCALLCSSGCLTSIKGAIFTMSEDWLIHVCHECVCIYLCVSVPSLLKPPLSLTNIYFLHSAIKPPGEVDRVPSR